MQRAFGQFVVGYDQRAIGEPAGNLVISRQRAGKARTAAAGDAHHRLQLRADRVADPFLGLVDRPEQHRPAGDDDAVDVVDRQLGIGQRPVDRFAHQPGLADIGAATRMMRLADPNNSDMTSHGQTSSVKTQLFCMPTPPAP